MIQELDIVNYDEYVASKKSHTICLNQKTNFVYIQHKQTVKYLITYL